MTRESRILLTLVVFAGAGVSGLMLVANQYKKALAHVAPRQAVGEDATVRAVRLVDGYLAARGAVKHVIERYPVRIKQLTAGVTGDFSEVQGLPASDNADAQSAYRSERWNTLSARGLTLDDYALVRAAWRSYRSGGAVNDEALVGVFRARRAALSEADLGPAEPLDDAIK